MARLPKNLYRRGDSYYLCVKISGHRHRVSLGRDFTEACRRLRIEMAKLRRGEMPAARPGADTAAIAEYWWEKVAKGTQCKGATRRSRNQLQGYFLPVVSTVPLAAIRPDHLRQVRERAEAAGLEPSTVYNVMSTVRAFLNWCVTEGVLHRSPWTRGLLPKLKQRAPDKLDAGQMFAILAAARGDDRFAVEFSLLTGIRRGELVRLRREHVRDLPSRHIVLDNTKSGLVRRVPLGDRAWAILQEQLKSHDRPYVLRHRTLSADWTVRRIGVDFYWHWHQLRHTFACRYVERGGRLAALQRILGHHSVKVTERYAQLTDESVFEDAARIELPAEGTTTGTTGDGTATGTDPQESKA